MTEEGQSNEIDYLADFLRDSINSFMRLIDIDERVSGAHEERVHYEEWVRFLVSTQLLPRVLAVACGVYDRASDVLNDGIPHLLERALATIPVDAEFIAGVMERLPDHERISVAASPAMLGTATLAEQARDSFNGALYSTLDVEEDVWE